MQNAVADLRLRMYLTLFLVLAIGFGILFALLSLLGVSSIGILVFVALFFIIQWYVSPSLLAYAAKLKYVSKQEQPKLYSMVSELAEQAKVPMPRIAISPSREPNAFVFGRTRKSATLVVHQGLLSTVNDEELRAVLAHEIGHLKHNDVVVMTFASFIPMLAYYLAITFLFGGFSNNRNSGAYAALIGFFAFVVYFLSELLLYALSRAREAYADAYSAQATNKPEHLASALAKITYSLASTKHSNSGAIRSFYIADNLAAGKDAKLLDRYMAEIKKAFPELDVRRLKEGEAASPLSFFASLFLTHPPTYKRILLLAKMKNSGKQE